MLPTDRDLYLNFAKSMQMDFQFLADIIDGARQASPDLARALASATNSRERMWTDPAKAKERVITVKVWWANLKRRPGYQTQDPPPVQTRGGGCPNCD